MIQQVAAVTAGLLARGTRAAVPGYGPLHPRHSENGGELLLALPNGFRYTHLSRAGAPMSDGNVTPRLPDGMAAFFVSGELRLVCNHEIREVTFPISAGPWQYDGLGGGGTTTIVVDPVTRLPIRQFVSLAGTITNCAGGPTPWGSWISCEESLGGAGFTRPHGYCFEVPAAADTPVAAVPLQDMGRFVHEAAAVDPTTGIVYLTEDQDNAGLYRFLPNQPGVLAAGGRLQMLAVLGARRFDGSIGQVRGLRLPVSWVDIQSPGFEVFAQGRDRGAARFRRLEGACFGSSSLFFTSTNGGDRGLGQIWQYRARTGGKQRAVRNGSGPWDGDLTLLFESPAAGILNMPDNICLTPWQTLMVCEDNGGPTYLRGVTRQGAVFPFAQNIAPGLETTEFAGACFSPDGQTLFVNMQAVGATLAIWGPWIN
jgi:secreted PhoX family phosphatase